MRISTGQIFQQGITSILNQQNALAKTQQQVATGKQISTPTDDPVGAVQILNFEREINLFTQYRGNADVANSRLSVEEDVLKSVTNVLQRVRELAVQSLNGTNTASDREDIAQEVRELNEELLSLANTQDASRNYLFSGFSTETQPYESIGATYAGDEGRRNIQVGPGVLIETNDPGNEIFEGEFTQTVVTDNAGPSTATLNVTSTGVNNIISPPVTISFATPDTLTVSDGTDTEVVTPYISGQSVVLSELNANFPDLTLQLDGTLGNGDSYTLETQSTPRQTVFVTINDFVNALESNSVGSNDSPNNGDFLTNISTMLETVVDARGRAGSRLNTVERQQAISEELSVNAQRTLSTVQDLDYSEAISRLTFQSTALQVAQQTFAQVQGLNLFNFL